MTSAMIQDRLLSSASAKARNGYSEQAIFWSLLIHPKRKGLSEETLATIAHNAARIAEHQRQGANHTERSVAA